MFYLLETVLAPVWVWLIFSEAPSRNSLIGGTILIVALVAHSLWQLAEGRRRRAAQRSGIRHSADHAVPILGRGIRPRHVKSPLETNT